MSTMHVMQTCYGDFLSIFINLSVGLVILYDIKLLNLGKKQSLLSQYATKLEQLYYFSVGTHLVYSPM